MICYNSRNDSKEDIAKTINSINGGSSKYSSRCNSPKRMDLYDKLAAESQKLREKEALLKTIQ